MRTRIKQAPVSALETGACCLRQAARTDCPVGSETELASNSRGAARIRTGGADLQSTALPLGYGAVGGETRTVHREFHRNTHATTILPPTTGPERLLRYASRETASPSQEERSAEAAQPLQSKRSLARGPSVGVLRRRGQGCRRELPLRSIAPVFGGIRAIRRVKSATTGWPPASGCSRELEKRSHLLCRPSERIHGLQVRNSSRRTPHIPVEVARLRPVRWNVPRPRILLQQCESPRVRSARFDSHRGRAARRTH